MIKHSHASAPRQAPPPAAAGLGRHADVRAGPIIERRARPGRN
ncbi:MAG: hypothetical protein V4631_15400 [Pseudomonadota bacterium]